MHQRSKIWLQKKKKIRLRLFWHILQLRYDSWKIMWHLLGSLPKKCVFSHLEKKICQPVLLCISTVQYCSAAHFTLIKKLQPLSFGYWLYWDLDNCSTLVCTESYCLGLKFVESNPILKTTIHNTDATHKKVWLVCKCFEVCEDVIS